MKRQKDREYADFLEKMIKGRNISQCDFEFHSGIETIEVS